MLLEFKNQISFSTKRDSLHEIHGLTTSACTKANTKASQNEPFQSKPTRRAHPCIWPAVSFTACHEGAPGPEKHPSLLDGGAEGGRRGEEEELRGDSRRDPLSNSRARGFLFALLSAL